MKDLVSKVRKFMVDKLGFGEEGFPPESLSDVASVTGPSRRHSDMALAMAASVLNDVSAVLLRGEAAGLKMLKAGEQVESRLVRASLVVEEAAELLHALARCDEVQALDAICDLCYVAAGTGLLYSLPMVAGMEAIHASNMTKTRNVNDRRLLEKGPDYRSPNLIGVFAHMKYNDDESTYVPATQDVANLNLSAEELIALEKLEKETR